MDHRISLASLIATFAISTAAIAQEFDLPTRDAPTPKTTVGVPHLQIGLDAVPELTKELLGRVAKFPGVNIGPTRVSLPGAVGFQLDSDLPLAHPEVIVGGLEFAHMHPDGSFHASLEPNLARAAVAAGWAIAHPWANQRDGWEGFVMIYTPQTQAELVVVIHLVEQSYEFVTGQQL